MTLPVLGGSEDLFAEQTVLLRLECSVVDRFGFRDLTQARLFDLFGCLCRVAAVGPLPDLIRGRESDFYRIKSYRLITLLFRIWHFYLISLRVPRVPDLLWFKR